MSLEHAQTSGAPRRRRGSWSEQAFEEIVRQFISYSERGKFYIHDISSPPGSGKTFTVLKFIVSSRMPAVCSFPTHQNQGVALTYIVSQLSKDKKLRMFVVDYAGLENYCIFYKPSVLKRLLDQFKPEGGRYVDAAQRLLGEDVMFRALLLRDTFAVSEKIYTKISEMFDAGKSDAEVLELVKGFIERRGQYEMCFGVCPVGLLYNFYKHHVYNLLSKPKVITWRYTLADKISKRYNFKHIVVANPARLVSNIKTVLDGSVNPEWLLCPRLVLLKKCTVTKSKDGKWVPTYISLRRAVVLTPHAALAFVLNLITRQKELTGVARKHLLYIDEYDALMMKPKQWKVFSLGEAKAIKALADMIVSAEEGESFRGVVVDEYLKRYAQYVSHVLGKVVDIVERSIRTGEYSPYTVLFIEGAFSKFRETTLETRVPVEYLPLGARILHIKYVLQDEELFKLIVNPKLFFADLSEKDPDWGVRFQEAAAEFRHLIRTVRCIVLKPVRVRSKLNSQAFLQLAPRERRAGDILSAMSDLFSHLLYVPRLVLYYAVGDGGLVVESMDVKLMQFLTCRHGILTSATPIPYDLFVLGTHNAVPVSDYESISKNVTFSFIKFSAPTTEEYDQYSVKKYVGKVITYTEQFSKELRDAVTLSTPIRFDASCVTASVLEISQISPITRVVKEYARIVKILPQPSLRPLTYRAMLSALSNKTEHVVQSVRKYVMLIDALVRAGYRVLVLTQNKEVALFLAKLMKMEKCLGETCGDVDKLSHFRSKSERVILTWFRSRIGRGVDIDVRTDAVVIVGSPYPQPRVFVNYKSYDRVFDSRLAVVYNVKPFNTLATSTYAVYRTLIPRDFVSGLNELAQALGRAVRSILTLDYGEVKIYIPGYVYPKFSAIAPAWLRTSIRGM